MRRPGRRTTAALAVAFFLLTGTLLFSGAVFGSDYLTPDRAIFSQAPFAATAPPGLAPTSNPALTDAVLLFRPLLAHARTSIQAGHLPLWDPQIGAGRPLGAQQGAPFFPTSWPSYVLSFADSYVWDLLLRIVIAATGVYFLCRRLGLRSAPAVVGGLAFALGNPFVPFLASANTNAYCLLPWMLWAGERVVERPRAPTALVLGGVSGVAFFAGHPESWAAADVTLAVFVALRLAERYRDDRSGADLRRGVLVLAGAGLVALCVGALALLPLAEILPNSINATRTSRFGDSLRDFFVGLTAPEYWGRDDKHIFNEPTFSVISSAYVARPYMGVVPLLLAGVGLGSAWRRRGIRIFVALAGLALLLMIPNPVWSLAHHLPGLSLINLHAFISSLVLSIAVLGAYGLDWLSGAPAAGRRRALLVAVGLAGAAVVVLVAAHPSALGALGDGLRQFPTLRPSTTSVDGARAGAVLRFVVLVAAVIGAGALLLVRRNRVSLFGAVAIALTAIDLITLGHGYIPTAPESVARPTTPPSIAAVRAAGPSARVVGIGATFAADLSDRFGVYDARAQSLPELRRYTRLFVVLGGAAKPGYGLTGIRPETPIGGPLFDVFGARYVIDAGDTPLGVNRGIRVLDPTRGARLLENTRAFPRAWIAYDWRTSADLDDSLKRIGANPDGLQGAPVIEQGTKVPNSPSPPGPALMTRSDDGRVDLEVDAKRAGYVVLNDTFYTGWTARVDGRTEPIRPANAAFRAVAVRAGHHDVSFRYEPESIRIGLPLTLLGLAAALTGAFWSVPSLLRRARKRRRS